MKAKLLTASSVVTLWLVLIVSAGCSDGNRPPLAPVEGRITLDGQPLAGATVVFQPTRGKSSSAQTGPDGRYELIYIRDIRGAIPGQHTVSITTASESQPQERLPSRYHSKTELTAAVKLEGGEVNFDLKSSP